VTTKTGVAIVGASGYAARELFRIMLNHPHAELTVATSRNDEEPSLQVLHPSLAGRTTLKCEPFDAARVAARASYAFLALPHTASMAIVPELRQRGLRVIDLSADYRLGDAQVYADWYGHVHTDTRGLDEAVYGLPELFREQIP
jgi:N-acetyl-gamma-glutamyl-phosphate reductase